MRVADRSRLALLYRIVAYADVNKDGTKLIDVGPWHCRGKWLKICSGAVQLGSSDELEK